MHLAGLQFAPAMGIQWTYIPSKGGAQAMQDVAGGHADLIFNSMLATAPHVKSGSLRLLAVTSPKRVGAFPDAPAVERARARLHRRQLAGRAHHGRHAARGRGEDQRATS